MRRFAAGWTIRQKGARAFVAILLVAMGPSVAAVRGLSAVHRAAVEVRAGWLPAARLLGQIGRAYAGLRIVDTRIVLGADPLVLKRIQALTVSNLDGLHQAVRSYEALPLPAVERRAAEERTALLDDYMEVRGRVILLAKSNNWPAAAELWSGEANGLFQSYNYRLDVSTTRMAQLADAATEAGEDTYRDSLWLLLEGAVAAVLVAVGTGLALVTLVASPITRMAGRLSRLAEGDLELDAGEPADAAAGADEIGAMEHALAVFKQSAIRAVRREAELKSSNVRLDAALGNMSQGLCMYDEAGLLSVVNARYCEIFGLPPGSMRPGFTLRQTIELRCAHGHHDGEPTGEVYRTAAAAMASLGSGSWTIKAAGGLTIEVCYRTLAGGGWVVTYDDITKRCQAEEQAVFLARHDALTGLPNRTLFQERVEQELVQAARGATAALHYLDLDHFKWINDNFGHPAGDSLLRAVADRLRALVRQGDMVARLGGDEFAVFQVGLERPEDAGRLAQRIVDALGAPFELESDKVSAGVSVGVALAPTDATQFTKLVKCADMALYRAKLDGRNGLHFFEQAMDTQQQARRELEREMRRGLAEGEFELFYQPLVNLEHGGISCFEALLRWRHHARGLVGPAEFIPMAEETGLIVQLGEWALQRACAEAATWPAAVGVAVNLSAVQFKSQALVPTVARALAASRLPGHRLELEITESVMLQDSKATLTALHGLRKLGVRIAMDDFGTGYSSLSYLRSFPFDKIKIDQSFIRDLGVNSGSSAIVGAVTGLGASLGMATTAEGVETHAQLAELRRQRCTEVQGYLFSPPCPASEGAALLRRSRQADWFERAGSEPAFETVG